MNNGGIRLTWGQVVGIATFVIGLGPALIFVGTLVTRVERIEKHVDVGGHVKMLERMAVREEIDRQTIEAIRKLNARLDEHIKEGD